ncbi:MAG: hypothetical protein KatS3mg076_3235 [Candidatus Binatia bacterium]|nr:MAG: hypothetical protein KatS3mg076_3235 [Candidatus Binatia bacterium]
MEAILAWLREHASALFLASALLALRRILPPEVLRRRLHDWLGTLGFARAGSTLVATVYGWGTLAALLLLFTHLAGLEGAAKTILGTMGFATLVAAFAGQHVIQNVLAGLLLVLDGKLQPGDRIEIGGQTGEVLDLELRCTLVRQEDGSVLLVPNQMLLTTLVKHRSLTPERLGQRTPPTSA